MEFLHKASRRMEELTKSRMIQEKNTPILQLQRRNMLMVISI